MLKIIQLDKGLLSVAWVRTPDKAGHGLEGSPF